MADYIKLLSISTVIAAYVYACTIFSWWMEVAISAGATNYVGY
jgi:hypothetical protein